MRFLRCSTTSQTSLLYFGEGCKILTPPTWANTSRKGERRISVRWDGWWNVWYLAFPFWYKPCLLFKDLLKDAFPNYCKMVENLPPLKKIMRLMQLARFRFIYMSYIYVIFYKQLVLLSLLRSCPKYNRSYPATQRRWRLTQERL